MKRNAIVSVLCLAAAACGGNSSSGNAAASKQFTYGTPGTATATQANALQSSLSSMATLQSAPDASSAAGFTEFSSVTDALVGTATFLAPGAGQAQSRALVAARRAALSSPTDFGTSFDNPACVAVTSTSVKLSGCTLTHIEGTGADAVTIKVDADGSVTLADANQTLSWDLTMTLSLTASSASGSGRFHGAGKVTAHAPTTTADGTIQGDMTTEVSMSASGGGQSASVRMDEALGVDVTYRTGPTSCVTGGTLEAKRVFVDWSIPNTSRPADKGAKIAWQSCGNATIALSTN